VVFLNKTIWGLRPNSFTGYQQMAVVKDKNGSEHRHQVT